MKSSNRPGDLIQIGRITGAHGIQGVVKVYSYAESVSSFDLHDDLIIMGTAGHRLPYETLWVRPHKNGVRLALKDVTTRSQAEKLIGCDIFIPKACLPELDQDSNYWFELIGMAVYTTDDEHLGQITEIIATGANDVYVVQTPDGHPAKEILLPAIPSVILEADVPGRCMRVKVPEGLI
ncbi:MAG: 16S rRNA processing protein RimM [Desulfobacterales bacterium]|nr:16S rRNA processing protein RimM [Desulfobacterales bacterium]